MVKILINPTHVLISTKNGFYNFAYFWLHSKHVMKKKIPPIPKSKSNYPTVVSDSTAHQKPSGDPFVNKGEN